MTFSLSDESVPASAPDEAENHPSTNQAPEHTLKSPPTWPVFLRTATDDQIKERFSREITGIITAEGDVLSGYCCLALLEPQDSIETFELDQIFSALSDGNPQHDKDVLLLLLSRGGNIEPAYQISKICKAYARSRFVVVVPRYAKSAATLLALGADEIHMGQLGQLGPIDPQLGGLPALGVAQALETIARLSERFPKSAEMFARYLHLTVTVEQIGYCDRIGKSAEQYAERLLSTKSTLAKAAQAIANQLVNEYKDHGFVIDTTEAQQHLGLDLIRTNTPEVSVAETIYNLFDNVNLFLGLRRPKRRLIVAGSLLSEPIIF